MKMKKAQNASAHPTTKKEEQSGTKVLDAENYVFFRPQVKQSRIIDADTLQAEANEVKPRPQPEVIVA